MKEIFAIEREDECHFYIGEVIDNIELSQLRSLTLESLSQLKSLENNSNCSNTLFSEKVALPSLEVLVLDDINVERIWQNPVAAMSCGIQNLTKLILWNCDNLKYLFSSSMIGSLDRLQYLDIYRCPALEEIMVIDDEDGLRKEERKNNVALMMDVRECNKLKTFFPQNTYRKFLRLESLDVSSCDLLEVIFDLEGPDFKDKHNAVVITQLRELNINYLPKLKQVWTKDPKRFVFFEKLKKVSISGCDVLKNVFPASIANSLSQLESLDIRECGVEEIVFVVEEEAETNSRFVFPRLISLDLRGLPKFTTFCRRYNTEWSISFFVEKVALPSLQEVRLVKTNVERIATMSCGIQNLTKLILWNCNNLKYLFSSSMIESIDRLQYLGIDECPALEEIMVIDDEEGLRKEERKNNVALKMDVRKCNKLKTLFPWNTYRKFLRLESLSVSSCDLLEVIFDLEDPDFKDKHNGVVITQLRKLVIEYLPKLKQVWSKDPKRFVSFEKLKNVRIIWCDVLKNVFPASVVSSLSQLESLSIRECGVEEIVFVADEEAETNSRFVFPRLISLELIDLPKFTTFFSRRYTTEVALPSLEVSELDDITVERIWQNPVAAMSCGIQNLTKLILHGCNNLKYLFSSSMIGSFDRLQYLEIYDCPALEEILVIDDEDGLRKEERKNNVALKMDVWKCHKLKTLFSRNTYKKFLRLESLSVSSCDLLEVIFDLEGPDFKDKHNAGVITQLRKLGIYNLPKLKQVWNKDPKRFVSFEKLKEVRIYGCGVLKNVFLTSIASSLSQLESLSIRGCGLEEIVFVVEEEEETNSRFVFPRLISLELSHLPKFTTFFSRRYTTEWSAPCFVEKIFPTLETLKVTISIMWEFPGDFICKMRNLEIDFDESFVISPLDFIQRFHSIKRLEINGKMYFDRSTGRGEDEKLAKINNLNQCFDLKHILKEESNMDHLIHLEVKDCDNLVNVLAPSLTSFRNLTTLEVRCCHALTNILTASTAKSMEQLRSMKIIECNKTTELLLEDEGDDTKDNEIVFSNLMELHLEGLRTLTSFCSANCTLKFSSLEELLVINCPQMKSFSTGNLSTPKLQKVKYSRRYLPHLECWNRDLNTTIQQLHEKM